MALPSHVSEEAVRSVLIVIALCTLIGTSVGAWAAGTWSPDPGTALVAAVSFVAGWATGRVWDDYWEKHRGHHRQGE